MPVGGVGLAVALPPLLALVGAFATPLLSGRASKPARFALVFSELILLVNLVLATKVFFETVLEGKILTYMFAGVPPPLGILYEVDSLGGLMGFLVALIFPLVNLASYGYLEWATKHNHWYYTIFLGLEAGLLGMAYTGDLFNLFVMLEVMSIAAYGLTAYLRERGRPLDAAIKYGLFGGVGSTIYFLAVVLLYAGLGTLTMGDVVYSTLGIDLFPETSGTASNVSSTLLIFAGLAVWAFMIEAAVFPHHFWLPDAYSSMPPSAAAAMAAVGEGVGLYVIIRILYTVVGPATSEPIMWLLIVLGAANILVGGYMTATATDFKRMVAYSTILDMGYAVVGVGIGGYVALAASLYYIISHAFVKPLLFLSAGVIERAAGTTELDGIRGIARGNAILAASLLVGGMAIIGVPPMNIFFAKLMLFKAVMQRAELLPLLLVMLVGSALAFIGFGRLWFSVFSPSLKGEVSRSAGLADAPLLVLFSALVILSGLLYGPIMDKVVTPVVAVSILGVGARYRFADAVATLKAMVGGW